MTLSVEGVLGKGGLIAGRLSGYEVRPQQLEMAEAVGRAIGERKHLVVEAGTGVGKSFAYLVPAILAAAQWKSGKKGRAGDKNEEKRRIVVSTHTISLQEQLINKDIPFLNAIMPVEFSAVLAKGRSNYISLRRLSAAMERAPAIFEESQELTQLRKIREWTNSTRDGSLSDLDFHPFGSVWSEVRSEQGNCLGRKCPRYEDCLYYKARRRLWNADVLVVNHALFFS